MIMVKHQTLRCSIFSEETWIPIAEYDDQPSNLGFSTMWNPKNNVKTVKIRGSSDNIKQPKGCSKELFCGFPKAHGQPLPQSLQIQNPTDHEAPRCHGRVWRWRNLTWRRGVDDDYSYHDDYIMFFFPYLYYYYISSMFTYVHYDIIMMMMMMLHLFPDHLLTHCMGGSERNLTSNYQFHCR